MTKNVPNGRGPLVAVVGVCAAGKSTLATGLQARGYRVISVPQEHSFVKRLWRHRGAERLVMLDATYETTCKRRQITYGPERLETQRERLAIARQECDLYLPTDDLGIEEVRDVVAAHIERWMAEAERREQTP
jgi:hypothetical protein